MLHLLLALGADLALPTQNVWRSYESLVDTYVRLSTKNANATIEIKALAQDNSLQILKTLKAQAAPDAMVSKLPDVQNPQKKQRKDVHIPIVHFYSFVSSK